MSSTEQPDVTVLMATHNRARSLEQTLERLALQRCAMRWRLVVVDNASSDDTPEVLARFAKDRRIALDRLDEPRQGKSRALNRGLDHIAAGLVVFIDDDIEMGPDWLQGYVEAAQRWPDHALFGGPVRPLFPDDAPAWVQDERYVRQSPMFAHYAPREDEGTTTDIPLGPNMAIRRSSIGDLRFDVRIGPGGDAGIMGCETEFELRLAALGHTPFIYVPGAPVDHRVRDEQLTRAAVWARAYKWGRSMALSERRSRRGLKLRGVPLRYWSGALRAWLRYAPFAWGPRHFQLKYGWQWQVRAGRVRGYLDDRDGGGEPPYRH